MAMEPREHENSYARQLSSREETELLEKRAALLARPHSDASSAELLVQVILFHIGDDACAIETRYVSEVSGVPEVTPLPDVPRHIAGVANLRGSVLPVVDLIALFDLPLVQHEAQQLVVMGEQEPEFGIIADGTVEMSELAMHQLGDPPQSVADSYGTIARGITPSGLILLDGTGLLCDSRIAVVDHNAEHGI